MKKIELILAVTAIVAIIANLFNYPMAGPLLIVSIGNLSFFYMYLSFLILCDIPFRKVFSRSTYDNISKIRIIGAFAFGLSISASLIGLLFKIMIWPNANWQIGIGLLGLLIAGGVSFWRYSMNKSDFYLRVFKRLAIFLPLAIFAISLSKYAAIEWKFRDFPDYVEAFKQSNENPDDEVLQEQLDEAWEKINVPQH